MAKIPVVAPAIDYWRTTIDTKKGAEVARLKVARIFNPLHVLGYPISVADIDSLKIFRLTEHPLIIPHIDGMKSEIIKYQALVKSIKPLDQRKDAKGKDTFVLSDWWRCNSEGLIHCVCCTETALPAQGSPRRNSSDPLQKWH